MEEFYIPSVSFLQPVTALTLQKPQQSSLQLPPVGSQCWRAGMPNVGRGIQDTPGIPPPFPLRRARRMQPLPPPWTPDPRP